MADIQPLQRAHDRIVTLEILIQGRLATLHGKARYDDGQLSIAVKDLAGNFALCIDEAKFDGEMTAAGERLTIRLNTK